MLEELQAILNKWTAYKLAQADKKKLTVDVTGTLVQQPGLSVKNFVQTIDGLSRELVATLQITDVTQWESLAELVNNATPMLRSGA